VSPLLLVFLCPLLGLEELVETQLLPAVAKHTKDGDELAHYLYKAHTHPLQSPMTKELFYRSTKLVYT
jgi:hypothetical protein